MYHSNSETRSSMASASERDALANVRARRIGTVMGNILFGVELHDDGKGAEKLDLVIWAPKQVVSKRPCLW